jgi:Flp pilus assembly protein CpaB
VVTLSVLLAALTAALLGTAAALPPPAPKPVQSKPVTAAPAARKQPARIAFPPGVQAVTLGVGPKDSPWCDPELGSRVDVIATVRHQNEPVSLRLLLNVQVVAIDTKAMVNVGQAPGTHTISFALDRNQERLVDLAKKRGFTFSLSPYDPRNLAGYADDIDRFMNLLTDLPGPAELPAGVVLPPGTRVVLLLTPMPGSSGWVGPGSRADILATVRVGNKLRAFPLLTNVPLVADNTLWVEQGGGSFRVFSYRSFALDEQQVRLVELAKQRGCSLSMMLRHPTKATDDGYDIDEVMKLLADLPDAGGK